MKLMTPATVKNLPGYLADDRQRSLLRRDAERYQEEKDSKEMAAEIGFKMLKATNEAQDQDDLFQRFDQIKSEYGGKVPPETMQIAARLVQKFGQEKLAGEDRAMKMEDRNRGKFLENQAISDTNILGQLAGSEIDKSQGGQGLLSSGGMEYDVPVPKQDLLGQLSGGGLLGYQEILGKQADAKTDAEKTAADIAYKKAQTEQLGKPRQEATPMSYREWQLAGSPGRYEDWVNRGKGSTQTADDVKADIQAQFGIIIDPGLPIETTPEKAREIQAYGQSRGLNVVVEPTKTGGGFFSDGEDAAIVRFGSFDPGRAGGQPGASTQTQTQGGTGQADINPVILEKAKTVYTELQKGNEQGAVDMLLETAEKNKAEFQQIMLLFPVEQRRAIYERLKQATTGAEELPRGDAILDSERKAMTKKQPPPNEQGLLLPGLPRTLKKIKDTVTDKDEWQKMVDFASQQ